MLMTKFTFLIHVGKDGSLHTVVSRLADGTQKYFFQASGTKEGMTKFLESMTDELVEGYYPKPNKRGGAPVDNWAFIGPNPERAVAEEMARVALIPLQIDLTCTKLKGTIQHGEGN